jgi:predicted RNase H-like HicB family nuclease
MPRIANVKARELIRLLHRMRLAQHNRDQVYFYHEWLNLWVMVSPGDREIHADLMGDIAIKQLKMNSADEFRCYAAICPAIDRAHGQGDTEAEALVDVADTMAIYLDHKPEKSKTGQAAQEAVSELIAELTADGVLPWIGQVVPARNQVPA